MGSPAPRAAAAATLLLGGAPASATLCGNHSAAGLRLNHAQVLATHNSYHVAPPASVLAAVPEWNYTLPPLDVQLDRGVRSFELDVYYDALAESVKVMHVPGSDEGSTCATLPECLQLARGWSEEHPEHFPLHFYIDLLGGVAAADVSSSGCTYADVQPAASCVETACVGFAASACMGSVMINCQTQLFAVVGANTQCSSLAGCIGPAIDTYAPDHVVTAEDVEAVLRECSSTIRNEVVSLSGAAQSAALAAVRAALDASFPVPSRVVPEDVQQDAGTFEWPEVEPSRGKAMFYVNAPSSWGIGDSAGFYFGPGGAMALAAGPAEAALPVAAGRWVRTRADEGLQIELGRREQALASGAQALATDFPPSSGPPWGALSAGTGAFWIPGGAPVRCNIVTLPIGVDCSSFALEDLAGCEEGGDGETTTQLPGGSGGSSSSSSSSSTTPDEAGPEDPQESTSDSAGGAEDGGDDDDEVEDPEDPALSGAGEAFRPLLPCALLVAVGLM